MKRFNFKWMIALAAATVMGFASCSSDDDGGGGTDAPQANMEDAALSGIVYDTGGAPLNGVRVSTGTLAATTGADGKFSFSKAGINGNRAIITFEKSGYFTVTRSNIKADEINIEVVLQAKGNSQTTLQETFAATEGTTLDIGGMIVEIPASALVKADGSVYSGAVKADMQYLAPDNANFAELMPGGDLAGIRANNSEAQLISYGMTEVSLTDNAGNPLNLRQGETSQLTFPIPEGMENNPPAQIPLWYFDDERGVWVEEGIATLQDGVYVGEVTHFSWHNLDYPEVRVIIKGKVTDCTGAPVPYVKVTAMQTYDNNGYRQGVAVTGSSGDYMLYIPSNTEVTLTVLPEDYDYGDSDAFSNDIPATAGQSELTRNISLPCSDGGETGGEVGGSTTSSADIICVISGGATQRLTFDNYGRRMRMETDDEGEVYAIVIDSIAKKFYMLTGSTWMDITLMLPWESLNLAMGDELSEMSELYKMLTSPPSYYISQGLTHQATPQTIAGKSCDVYSGTGINSDTGQSGTVRVAKWNGLTMMIEFDGTVELIATSVTLDVPDSLFGPSE
ncbi:MAG: carboxypeptidase-like regulatory domain-containing protein [Prevotella sp.]|jgi:ethanolamine utilization microcompartment shell protein EutL|nr:carboxypeptidase-like regulatory domain-containing protein [Prevotella sp.]